MGIRNAALPASSLNLFSSIPSSHCSDKTNDTLSKPAKLQQQSEQVCVLIPTAFKH